MEENLEKKDLIKKKRKNIYKKLLIFILPLIIIFLVLAFLGGKGVYGILKKATGDNQAVVYSGAIEQYGYYLRNNPTEIQKEYFKELKDVMENESTDEQKVEAVVKNYIADMYTWTNKAGSYDVGGMCYVYDVHKSLTTQKARDGFYKYVSYYIDKYGSDALLEVKDVEVSAIIDYRGGYVYHNDGNYHEGPIYAVEVKWNYVDKANFNNNNYTTVAYMIVAIQADGRVEILESYGEE